MRLRSSFRMAVTFWSPSWMTPPCMSRRSMLRAPGKFWTTAPSAGYAAGHLFYSRGTGLFARPFDPERLEFSGAEVQVTERAGGVSVSDQRHDRLPPGRRLEFPG